MRAIVLAYHDIGCTGIEALLEHGFDIAGVLTHADDPHETAWFRSVAELAARRGLPVFAPKTPNHPLWLQKIRDLAPDVLFSFYYREMLSEELLAIPKQGCFNLHGSLLPAYRGRAPANWAILNGETETGVTLHHMIARPDAGDIVGQRRVPITPADDARTLNLKLADAARELLAQTLPLIRAGTAPRIPQDESAATYYGQPHARRRRDRLAQVRGGHREPRTRRHAAVSGRVHLHACQQDLGLAGRGTEERGSGRAAGPAC